MVAPISTSIVPKMTRTSIFYVNDGHSQIDNMQRLKTASDEFDSFESEEKADKLKFSAGDFCLGLSVPLAKLGVITQNSMGIMATAGGNHEFDLKKEELVEVLKGSKYKFLGLNVDVPDDCDANKELKKDILKSYVQEQNGTKYGVIGLFPPDFHFHATDPVEFRNYNILSIKETAPRMQKEIDELNKQGVNKIIVLSHSGYNADVELAKSVEGIDVIIGGHTHDLMKGLKEGKNLFYSKKTGEPTIITQAGKDGNYFGVLNVEFDEKGVIKKAQNNVNKTEDFRKSPLIKYFTDKFLGKAEVVGKIASAQKETPSLTKESASADFICDAERKELGTDVTIMNSGNMRASIESGPLTTRDIAGLTPFQNKMCIVPLTEKELVDAIKTGAKSMVDKDSMPGILQVSGLKYTMTKSGEVKEIKFIDKNKIETIIDINNPSETKIYRAAMDDYVAKGGNNYIPNKLKDAEARFDFDKDKLVIDYVKKRTKPINIKADGRITILD